MKKNRLQDCPDAIGSLSRLKRLELDGEQNFRYGFVGPTVSIYLSFH